jgi:aminoglycoside 6'-N-acetyltransferase I
MLEAMTTEIRQVRPGDEALFDRIADDVFDHAFDPQVLSDYLSEPGHHLIIALHDGEIIGQVAAVVHKHPDLRATELYVDEVAVTPAFQRQGIARRMLDEMFELGTALGCEEAWVGTGYENGPAMSLYASRGSKAEAFAMYVFKL